MQNRDVVFWKTRCRTLFFYFVISGTVFIRVSPPFAFSASCRWIPQLSDSVVKAFFEVFFSPLKNARFCALILIPICTYWRITHSKTHWLACILLLPLMECQSGQNVQMAKKMTFLNTFSTKEKWPLLARCFDYYQLSCGQNYSNIHSFTFLKFSCIGNAFCKFQSSCGCENSTQQVLVLKLYLYINGLKMIEKLSKMAQNGPTKMSQSSKTVFPPRFVGFGLVFKKRIFTPFCWVNLQIVVKCSQCDKIRLFGRARFFEILRNIKKCF